MPMSHPIIVVLLHRRTKTSSLRPVTKVLWLETTMPCAYLLGPSPPLVQELEEVVVSVHFKRMPYKVLCRSVLGNVLFTSVVSSYECSMQFGVSFGQKEYHVFF